MEKQVKTTLIIMAAGIGSRFGGGIKQLEPVGPNGEIIMDYSIHDALEAGFDKVVFVIRRDLEQDFKEIIGSRIEKICEVAYAYQELDALPAGFTPSPERKKPWGTGHAVMVCRDIVKEPFAVINADDYYGKEAFRAVHEYLVATAGDMGLKFCMAGFILKNTLSENGGVSRGVCKTDANSLLVDVEETHNIVKTETGAGIAGETGLTPIDEDSYVSMNFWGLTPAFFPYLEKGFADMLTALAPDDIKKEYYLPAAVDVLVKDGLATVKVLPTHDKWFGVTYKADKQSVVEAFKKLYADGVYKGSLFQAQHN